MILKLFTEPFINYSCTVSAATSVGDGPATVAISGVTMMKTVSELLSELCYL